MKKSIIFIVLTILVFLSLPFNLHSEEVKEKTVKIAIIPWKVRAPEEFSYIKEALYDMISSRIAVERQISMVMEASSKKVFSTYAETELTDDLIREMGKELGADYIISGSLTLIGNTLSLDAMAIKTFGKEAPIHTVSQGKGAESIIPLLGRMALDFNEKILKREGLSPTVSGFGGTPKYVGSFRMSSQQQEQEPLTEEGSDFLIVTRESSTKTKLWKSQTFATRIIGMAVGDTDGNGNNEIVLIDLHNLWIYRKTSSTLEFLSEFKGKRFSENLTVDVADLNNNGIDEIYVTSWAGRKLDSYVLEYQDGTYKEIASGLSWFLRVQDLPESGKILLGQKTSGGQFFQGDVKKLSWKDNQLSDTESLDMPSGLSIYGFARVDFDADGKVETVSYDFSDRIAVHTKKSDKKWEKVWTSDDYFGGTLNKIERESGVSKTSEDDNVPQASIKSRILQRDLDRDGEIEVILNRNITSKIGRFFDKSREYKKGEIVNLIWVGNSLEENWKTKILDGYIADFQIDDIDNDGFKDLVIILITQFGGTKTKPASHLVSYKLNVR